MKKLLLISMLIGAIPMSMMAQDDDLYFVPKKKKATKVEKVKDIAPVVAPQPKAKSSYEVIDGDTTNLDVIDFTEGKGVYPADSLETEDFALTKNMVRFDDYDVSDNDAFWAGYRAGRSTWMWHSPWYYGRYGWYDPWYYGSWYGYSSWYSPYYYSWYDPWFYGWYDPWYGPYYGYYGWGWPYYRYGGYAYYYGGGYGRSHYYGRTGNAGTIDVTGRTNYRPAHRNTVSTNGTRMSSLRDRASRMGGNRVYTSGNTQRSNSGNFSGRRGGNTNYSAPTRSNSSYSSGSSSFGGSRSSSSSGSFGGSRSSGGGGGGSRMGGRR